MHELAAVTELVTGTTNNTFQADYNGHIPFSQTYYLPLLADHYDPELDFEYQGQIYQLNGISAPSGQIFAPYDGGPGNTFGAIDCGAVGVLAGPGDLGGYTAFHLWANNLSSGHC